MLFLSRALTPERPSRSNCFRALPVTANFYLFLSERNKKYAQLLALHLQQYICSLEGSLYFRRGRGSDNRRTIQARKVLCCFRPVGHLDGSSNIDCCVSIGTGEEQKKLDVLSNEVL
ncbi:hypothetical protein HanXRQr2_Chr13g0607881 [Helianthus annuus]|uniref:Uncharacterized protein n=1 Tax=Helianthus annuus TaxID=4232 RepID=A0A251SVP5_HELAN|nr:hypothetical protein HanXRQr2_Chr13g0607881 [Helianthus annuus]KAJ0850892.1 hypothetical protein HanPSC8_Chr13g0586111 [Helianthus annuus]